MIEQDTIKLLRECDAGIQMGVNAIREVEGRARNRDLRQLLTHSKNEHQLLDERLREQLDRFQDQGKSPNPLVESMSWLKTHAKLLADPSDRTVAGLMSDGCSMGVKSLNRYLNQYRAASESSKELTKKLIQVEESLLHQLQPYL